MQYVLRHKPISPAPLRNTPSAPVRSFGPLPPGDLSAACVACASGPSRCRKSMPIMPVKGESEWFHADTSDRHCPAPQHKPRRLRTGSTSSIICAALVIPSSCNHVVVVCGAIRGYVDPPPAPSLASDPLCRRASTGMVRGAVFCWRLLPTYDREGARPQGSAAAAGHTG